MIRWIMMANEGLAKLYTELVEDNEWATNPIILYDLLKTQNDEFVDKVLAVRKENK